MILQQHELEGYSQVLALIASRLVKNTEWAIRLLEVTANRLSVALYMNERDTATELSRAIECGEQVAQRSNDSVPDIVALAHLLARAERLDEALSWIDRAIRLNADDAEFHRFRGSVLARMGRFVEAEVSIDNALRLKPSHLDLQKDKLFVSEKINASLRQERDTTTELSRSIELGKIVVQRCENNAEDIVALTHLLVKANQLEDALGWIDRAIVLSTENPELYHIRVRVLEKMGRFYSACETAQKGLLIIQDNRILLMDLKRTRKFYLLKKLGLLSIAKVLLRKSP